MSGLDDLEDKVATLFSLDPVDDKNEQAQDTQGSNDQSIGTEQSQPASENAAPTEGTTGVEGAKQGNTPDTKGQQPTEQPKQQEAKPTPNPHDIVDPRTGEVIAAAGKERRWYEESRRAKGEVSEVKQKLTLVETELNAFKQAAVLPQQLGLQPAEVASAMQFMAHFKTNPVEAAKKVLAEVQAAGYTIQDLGGTDVAAIKQIVADAIKPFNQDREAVTQQEQLAREVEQEYNSLVAEAPWVVAQDDDLAKIMAKDRSLTLREAALKLENFALREGYDLNRSVEAQYFERQQTPKTEQTLPAQRPNRAAAPAQTTAVTGNTPVAPRNQSVTSNHSTRDIVREAMREHGINVDNL